MSSFDFTDFSSIRWSFIRGLASTSFIKILGAVLAFILQVYIARILGVKEYGVYTYLFTWMMLISLVSPGGIDKSAIRFIPKYLAENSHGKIKHFISWAQSRTFFYSIFAASLTFIVAILICENSNSSSCHAAFVAILLIPITANLQTGMEIIRAFRKMALSELSNLVIRPLLILTFITFATLLFKQKLTAYDMLLITVIGALLSLFTQFLIISKIKKPFSESEHAIQDTNYWLKTAIPLLLLASSNIILSRTDLIMLGVLEGTDSSGYYNAASRIALLVGFPLIAINAILGSIMSQLFNSKQIENLRRIIKYAAWVCFLVSVLASFFVVLLSTELLQLFGQEFTAHTKALHILVIGQVICSLAGPAGYLLIASGSQNNLSKIVAASALLNIILNLILIPMYGVVGAALSTIISLGISNLSLALVGIKKLKINPTIFQF